ncbi:RHS repeat domain-containing protein [Pedobacter sp. SL55]|uniref:RHS repeat domain-containing protein n=1 Tax=Pedobacter sp. SL55 TaxID=2995161 RepID=UPI0022702F92|nr:RHS repeat-associated core domain-containing protein [Pedobacter sp. SL55]WAC40112.1 hypothetical protein OVA16_16230 [Pedobacter sp. SL55]
MGTKKLDYEYDLVSGKVNFLAYQHGNNDAFYYKYNYDAENRLTEAWSALSANIDARGFGSSLGANKRLDATYRYYLHGPLARMELGNEENKVQGIDYAYTLQGWLKGVNSTNLNPNIDMGRDGSATSTIGKDAYSYTLHYYGQNDYVPIGTFYNSTRPFFGGYTANEFKPLYNGNIAMMGVNIPKVGPALQYAYRYDQLNRITQTTTYEGLNSTSNIWTPNKLEDFRENFAYDANGNILTLQRKGNNTFAGMPLNMDNLKYSYYYIKADGTKGTYRPSEDAVPSDAVAFTNQLSGVADTQDNTNNYPNDIDHQTPTNYVYDRIGNLIKDRKEGLVSIDWNVYGKIKSIGKDLNGDQTIDKTIAYQYDASGNRVGKTYDGTSTYYVRDAQGNTLAVYDKQDSNPLYWREQQLYGSSRLGMWKPNVILATGNAQQVWNDVGNKFFELSNHLGNVLAVISDKRVPLTGGGYEAEVVSANDYYAFGGQMPGRNFNLGGSYRYGFNGKENDNEVGKGEGGQQDYGMRIYNPRIGKFLSVNPLTREYAALTPYQFSSNNPIAMIDVDGLEGTPFQIAQAVSSNRAYEADLHKKDPKNADAIIRQHNIDAFLFVGGALTGGAGRLATIFWDGVMLFGGYKIAKGAIKKDSDQTMEGVRIVAGAAMGEILSATIGLVIKSGKPVILDFFGGQKSNIKGALNVDPVAEAGFKGTIEEFVQVAKKNNITGKVDKIVANNPFGYSDYIADASQLLKKGGTITVRGTESNKYFNQILKGTAEGLENFEVLKSKALISEAEKKLMKTTTGKPITGDVYEVILKKK